MQGKVHAIKKLCSLLILGSLLLSGCSGEGIQNFFQDVKSDLMTLLPPAPADPSIPTEPVSDAPTIPASEPTVPPTAPQAEIDFSIRTKAEIQKELEDREVFYPGTVLGKITLLGKPKQADPEPEAVYIAVENHTDEVQMTNGLLLTYRRSGDGWVLDRVDEYPEGNRPSTPRKGPSDSSVGMLFLAFNYNAQPQERPVYTDWEVVDRKVDLAGKLQRSASRPREAPYSSQQTRK